MDRRTVLKGAGGAVTVSLLAGCLGSDDSPGDASIWHELPESRAESLQQTVVNYQSEQDVQIAVEEIQGLEPQIETAVEAGTAPELYTMTHDRVGDHWERGFLVDGSEYLDIDVDEAFFDLAANAVRPPNRDEIIGLPYAGEVPTLLFNGNHIDEPPTTVTELVDAATEFHAPDENRYGFTSPVDSYFTSMWLQAFGGVIFETDDDGEPTLGIETDEFHEGVELYRDHLYDVQSPDLSYDDQTDAFARGDALFHINGPWAIEGLETAENVDLGVAPVPELDGGQLTPYQTVYVWYFTPSIETDENRRDAALSFAEWYTTDAGVADRLAQEHVTVPLTVDSDIDGLPDEAAAFFQTFERGTLLPSHADADVIWDHLDNALTDVLVEGDDIAERFSAAAADIREEWDEEESE